MILQHTLHLLPAVLFCSSQMIKQLEQFLNFLLISIVLCLCPLPDLAAIYLISGFDNILLVAPLNYPRGLLERGMMHKCQIVDLSLTLITQLQMRMGQKGTLEMSCNEAIVVSWVSLVYLQSPREARPQDTREIF